jgi:hypothetical protein
VSGVCEVTGVYAPMCDHCAEFGDFLRREGLPPGYEDAAARLLEEGLHLRMYGERAPGAPHDDPEAETWAWWDRRVEGFLRRRSAGIPATGPRR